MEETATKIIPDLGSDLIKYVQKHLKDRILGKKKPIGQYRGGDVYQFGDAENGYIVLVEDNEVAYFVRHRRISHNGFRLGRQVLLWRNSDSQATNGFAQTVFFNILLPKYGALIADKEQTRNGAAFWANAIVSAFSRSLHVYFLDRRSRKTQLIELLNDADVEKHRHDLWGNQRQHLLTFAVISNHKLQLKRRD